MNVSEALLDGAPAGSALAWSAALHYGHGVFRTCLIYDGDVIDIEEQIDKVISDALYLGLTAPDRALLLQEARRLAGQSARAVLKLLLLSAGTGRGYAPSAGSVHRLLCRYPAPAYPAAHWDLGVRAFRSSFRLGAQPALAGIKHLNRLEQVLAAREWPAGCDEGIVEDDAGRPVCGTRTNLFWSDGETLYTPPLERCGVRGLMRDKVLRAAGRSGVSVRQVEGNWSELDRAAEIFVTNSLIGLWPVRQLGAWTAEPGPLTRRLMAAVAHPRLESR